MTLKSSSLGPSPNLIVQLPVGEGWSTFQPMIFLDPGVAMKWTGPSAVPPHGGVDSKV